MKILVISGETKPEVENIRGLNLAGNEGLSHRCLQYELKKAYDLICFTKPGLTHALNVFIYLPLQVTVGPVLVVARSKA
jgi:hypothetical protein